MKAFSHLVGVGEAELGEHAARQQQAGGVGGGPVGQPDGQAVLGQLVRVRGRHDHVARKRRVHDLRARGVASGVSRLSADVTIAPQCVTPTEQAVGNSCLASPASQTC